MLQKVTRPEMVISDSFRIHLTANNCSFAIVASVFEIARTTICIFGEFQIALTTYYFSFLRAVPPADPSHRGPPITHGYYTPTHQPHDP
jgi:hypothetical protein